MPDINEYENDEIQYDSIGDFFEDFREAHEPEFTALAYINMANVYVKQGRLAHAKQVFCHIHPLIQSNSRHLSFYYQAKAKYYQTLKLADKAEQHHMLAIDEMASCGHQYYQAEMILGLCEYLLESAQLTKLDQQLERGLNIARQIGTDKLIDGFNDLLIQRMDQLQDFEQKEKTYELLLSSYQRARESARSRETTYLKQIYQLNMDRLKLESVQDINSNLSMVNSIGQYISTCDRFEEIIGQLTKDLSRLFIIDTLAIAFYHPEKQQLHIDHYYEEGEIKQPITVTFGDEATFFEYCAKHNRPLYFNNMTSEKKRQLLNNTATHDSHNSLMFAPISINGKVKAIFTMQAQQCYAYQTFHYELFLQLATYLSIALENQLNRKKLTKLSQTDHLTQVWNRQSLDIHFQDLLLSPPERLSVLMFDIDCYKQFNDRYGHIKGDETLVTITQLIRQHFSCPEANVYRYGGDEFVVIVHSHPHTRIKSCIACLQEALYQLNLANEKSTCADRLSLSIGCAYINANVAQLSLSECLHRADMALYEAKRLGRNQYIERHFDN